MKKKVFVSRLLGMALVLCMAVAALGCLPVVAAGESQGTVTANVRNHDYRNYGVRATPIGSHLVDNGDGTLTRVEYTGENIVVETYGSDLSFISGFTVDMELPIYGGSV